MKTLQASHNTRDLANEYSQRWNTPKHMGKVLVIVEGASDQAFFSEKLDVDKVWFDEHSDYKGCIMMDQIKEEFKLHPFTSERFYLIIKDSDYSRLRNNASEPADSFFLTDGNDLEMMCLKQDEARREFIRDHVHNDEELYKTTLDELEVLSYFKWMNLEKHNNYVFDSINCTALSTDILCDFNQLEKLLSEKSRHCSPITEEEFRLFAQKNKEVCVFERMNGHDFIKRLCFNSVKCKHKNLGKKATFQNLYSCMNLQRFKMTLLYAELSEWERLKGVQILLE